MYKKRTALDALDTNEYADYEVQDDATLNKSRKTQSPMLHLQSINILNNVVIAANNLSKKKENAIERHKDKERQLLDDERFAASSAFEEHAHTFDFGKYPSIHATQP